MFQMETKRMERTEIVESSDIEYPKAKLYKRWFSGLIDIILTLFIGFLLYGITALVTNYVPSYKENSQTRLKLEIESGLYDSTGNLILNTLEDSKDSYDSKKTCLSKAIDGFYSNSTFFDDDTAITNKAFTVGQTVDITAFIVHSNSKDKNGNQNERGLQISNWNSEKRERVSGTSAIVSTTEVEAMKPIELDEAGYKALTYDKVGNLYTFEAEYVSGKPSKGTGANVKFKLGNTDIVLRTDKFDPAAPSDTLVAGKTYKITAPLSWFNGAQFAYASSGVSIVEADAKPLEVSYTGNAYVGKEVTLVTTANGVKVTEGVTYTIEEGSNLASLENGVLNITGEGTIKVKATYVKDGKTLTAEVTINATALALSKISELKSMTSGKVKSRGYVMGYTGTPRIDYGLYDKVFIADGEDYFILYKVQPEQLTGIKVGDLIEFTGDISHYANGSVTTYETKNNVITKLTEADPSIVKPTATELTSSSAAFAFGQDNISKAYKINQGVVISNTEDSSGNMTVKFTLGSYEYDLFMDSRDYDITKDPFTKLTAGAVFNADVFAAATNFFCPSNIEIVSQQEMCLQWIKKKPKSTFTAMIRLFS